MPISRVIMNASPIICLIKAGITDILPSLFKDIVVPEEVKREILVKGANNLKEKVFASYQWIRLVDDIVIAPQVASWDLGQGESAVISFVLENPDFWAVIDDREARRCAMALQPPYRDSGNNSLGQEKRGHPFDSGIYREAERGRFVAVRRAC